MKNYPRAGSAVAVASAAVATIAGCSGGTSTPAATAAPRPAVTVTRTAPPKVVTVTPKPPKTVTTTPAPTTQAPTTQAPTTQAPTTQAPPAAPAAPAPGLTDPEAVVTQFYADISAGNYSAAWALGGSNIAGTTYANWVAGYSTTASISVTSAENLGSDQVSAGISAVQQDGAVLNYSGTYTVNNGVIISANISQQ